MKKVAGNKHEPVVRIPPIVRLRPIVAVEPQSIVVAVQVEHVRVAIAVGFV
ncbi:MAG: hypothetical protein AAB805_00775 [Patescibacteria group bacterium]|mgnify:FL=1